MALDLARYRFSLDQYERMVETGVLTEDDRVELIEGEILEMPPQHPPHTTPVRRLTRALMEGVGDRAVVLIQMPIRLPPSSEPEPDLALARPPDERYVARHPEPQDLLLVVEVSHTTQLYDRNLKIPLYARRGSANFGSSTCLPSDSRSTGSRVPTVTRQSRTLREAEL